MNAAPQRNRPGKISDVLVNLGAGLNPMKSCTFLVALGVTALAAWAWLKKSGEPGPHFPFYGTIAVSYAAGFLIGRLFWKLIKTTSVVAAFVLGGLAPLSWAPVDTS